MTKFNVKCVVFFSFIWCIFDAYSIVYHLSVCMLTVSLPVLFCCFTYFVFFLLRLLPFIRNVHWLVGLRLRALYGIVVVPLVSVIGVYVMYIVFRVLSSLMRLRSYIVVASPDFIVRCVFVSLCTLNLIVRCSFSFCYICTH